jgi:hypothetical protein
MISLWTLLRGGALKAHRAEVLGVAAGIGGFATALAQWAVGDLSLLALLRAVAENWGLIAGGLGVATLSAKIGREARPMIGRGKTGLKNRTTAGRATTGESVSDIASRALRR